MRSISPPPRCWSLRCSSSSILRRVLARARLRGAVVTVESATGRTISVTAKVKLAAGYALQSVIQAFTALLEKYRKEKAFAATYISQSVIGALLLNTEGVVDYSGLKLNGGTANIPLLETEVPLFGNVVLEV